MTVKNIFWFRQDLRIEDNPGLIRAAENGSVLPIYILDDRNPGNKKMGQASRWWLHHSLELLSKHLEGHLAFFEGEPKKVLDDLIQSEGINGVYWNRCYEPWRIQRDKDIKQSLKKRGIIVNSYNASLLWEPWTIHNTSGEPFKVFTPFYKKGCLGLQPPREPLGLPKPLKLLQTSKGTTLANLKLISHKKWENKLQRYWKVGEKAAKHRLDTFVETGLKFYKRGRDFPACDHVSRLSPYLHFGEISPNAVWHATKGNDKNNLHFRSELGWREFSYYLLYHFPTLPEENFQKKFNRFPWKESSLNSSQWKNGLTGIPFVDAAMRELWKTGYMHNRMRMVVGSFLTKNLLIHWHIGKDWFWDCLVDADLANNSAGWQWIAGCGADSAPYFRLFNPVSQVEKFDPNGTYIRCYVPELVNLPIPYLFSPWTAPEEALRKAGVYLGKTYPYPIVDLKTSREDALKAFSDLEQSL